MSEKCPIELLMTTASAHYCEHWVTSEKLANVLVYLEE